jgi:hypothetical protein
VAAIAVELVIAIKQAVRNTIVFMSEDDQVVFIEGLGVHKLEQLLAIC